MSHVILIPFYYTFLAVIDYASSDLVKLTKCILNNDLSIFLMIKLYTFIIFLACGTGLVLDTTNQVCVCAVDYYQTTDGSDTAPPTCAECPPGSTTNGDTNSNACGMYDKRTFPFPRYGF